MKQKKYLKQYVKQIMEGCFPYMMKNIDPQITAKLLKTKDKNDCKQPDKISITYKTMILTANIS